MMEQNQQNRWSNLSIKLLNCRIYCHINTTELLIINHSSGGYIPRKQFIVDDAFFTASRATASQITRWLPGLAQGNFFPLGHSLLLLALKQKLFIVTNKNLGKKQSILLTPIIFVVAIKQMLQYGRLVIIHRTGQFLASMDLHYQHVQTFFISF